MKTDPNYNTSFNHINLFFSLTAAWKENLGMFHENKCDEIEPEHDKPEQLA